MIIISVLGCENGWIPDQRDLLGPLHCKHLLSLFHNVATWGYHIALWWLYTFLVYICRFLCFRGLEIQIEWTQLCTALQWGHRVQRGKLTIFYQCCLSWTFHGGETVKWGKRVQRWRCFYGRFFVDCWAWGDNSILTKYLDLLVCLPHQKLARMKVRCSVGVATKCMFLRYLVFV